MDKRRETPVPTDENHNHNPQARVPSASFTAQGITNNVAAATATAAAATSTSASTTSEAVKETAIPTPSALVTTFCDFLTVAIHLILYERQIYSKDLFLTTRVYNHAVRQIRHPRLCKWIQDAVEACEVQITEGRASKIAVVILSPEDHSPLERFIFDVSAFPVVPVSDRNTLFEQSPELLGSTIADIEEHFRASLAKLSQSCAVLGKLPENCAFTVTIELKNEAVPPAEHHRRWIASEYQPASKDSPRKKTTESAKTTPVRSVEAGPMLLEMWVEESKSKQ